MKYYCQNLNLKKKIMNLDLNNKIINIVAKYFEN